VVIYLDTDIKTLTVARIGFTVVLLLLQIPLVRLGEIALDFYRVHLPTVCTESEYFASMQLSDYFASEIGDTLDQFVSPSTDGEVHQVGSRIRHPSPRIILVTGERQRYLIPHVTAYMSILRESGEDARALYILLDANQASDNPSLREIIESSLGVTVGLIPHEEDRLLRKPLPHPSCVGILVDDEGRIQAQSQFMTPCLLKEMLEKYPF